MEEEQLLTGDEQNDDLEKAEEQEEATDPVLTGRKKRSCSAFARILFGTIK